MRPLKHVLYGFFFSVFMLYLFPQIQLSGALIIWLSSFLIDVDHYLFYVFIAKDLNFKRAYLFFLDKCDERVLAEIKHKVHDVPLCFFHTIEAVIVLSILSLYSSFALYVLIGFGFHYLLDAYITFYVHRIPHERRYTIFWYVLEHI